MDEEVVGIIRETAVGIGERYAIEVEAMGMDRDHVHILCSTHPKMSPGEVVRVFKSITAREIFRRRPIAREELWGGEFWADGYYVATVGERGNWKKVEEYIMSQGKPREELKQLELF